MFIVCHRYGGRVGLFDTAVHNIHSDIFVFTFAFILAKSIFSLSSAIVFAIPKWFSFAGSMTLCCNSFCMTIQFCFKRIPFSLNVSLGIRLSKILSSLFSISIFALLFCIFEITFCKVISFFVLSRMSCNEMASRQT